MKKSIKKITAATFACLLALQTAIVPTHARPVETVRCITNTSQGMQELSFGFSNKDDMPFMPTLGTLYINNYNNVIKTFDLTNKMNQLSQVTNPEWRIGFGPLHDDGNVFYVYSVKFVDNKDNVIIEKAYSNPPSVCYADVLSFNNKLKQYDLNYDGQVSLEDAQLAQKFALGIKDESSLQVVLGDTNNNGMIDSTDVQRILNAALNI